MDDLVTWLRAQLDEDERVAQECDGTGDWEPWEIQEDGRPVHHRVVQVGGEVQSVTRVERPNYGLHIARHDPARVLREVAAKRAIMAMHSVLTEPERHGDDLIKQTLANGQTYITTGPNHMTLTGRTVYYCYQCDDGDSGRGPYTHEMPYCDTLRHLAAVYSDRDGYRPEWAPDPSG